MAQSQLRGGGKVLEGRVYSLSDRLTVKANTSEGAVFTQIFNKRKDTGNLQAKTVALTYSALKALQRVEPEVDSAIQGVEPYTMVNYHGRTKYVGIHHDPREIRLVLETRTANDLNLLNKYSITLVLNEWRKLMDHIDQLVHDLEELYAQRHSNCEMAGRHLKVKRMKWVYAGAKSPPQESELCFYMRDHALRDAMHTIGDRDEDNYKVVEVEQPAPRMMNLMTHVVQYCFLILMEMMHFRDNGRMEIDGKDNPTYWFPDGQPRTAMIHVLSEGEVNMYFPKVKRLLCPTNGFMKTVFTKCCMMMQMIGYKYFCPDDLLDEIMQKRFSNEPMFVRELFFLHSMLANRGEVWLIREAICSLGPCFDIEMEMVNLNWLSERVEEVLHVASPAPLSESEEEEQTQESLSLLDM
jgi:hypothetical protein